MNYSKQLLYKVLTFLIASLLSLCFEIAEQTYSFPPSHDRWKDHRLFPHCLLVFTIFSPFWVRMLINSINKKYEIILSIIYLRFRSRLTHFIWKWIFCLKIWPKLNKIDISILLSTVHFKDLVFYFQKIIVKETMSIIHVCHLSQSIMFSKYSSWLILCIGRQ